MPPDIPIPPLPSGPDDTHDDSDDIAKKSASTRLVEIAQELYRFGVSTMGEPFAILRAGPKVVATLRGSRMSLRAQLAREYFKRTRRAASQQALADALAVIEGLAQESAEHSLYLRVAKHGGAHWLDLGDNTGRAVKITDGGWSIEPEPPILFQRTSLTGALPEPESGSLDELWDRLNVAEADRPLIAAWLVAVFDPDMPHPVLGIFGEHGVAKTSGSKNCTLIIDPGPVPVRKPPRDAESWVTAGAGSWIVALDNLSTIPDWLSDSICRAVTGDGDVRRRLYTDGEHAVFSFRRCVIVNSIDLGAVRGDLSERMLPIELEPIAESRRMTEDELWQSWSEVHPRILGAVLDLAARVASVLPGISLSSKRRMADFARVVAAVDEILGTDGLSHYLAKQNALATDSLSGDPFMVALGEQIRATFTGTSSELLETIRAPERLPKHWPASARSVTQHLRRHAPALRRSGWEVSDDGGANHRKALTWTLVPPVHPEKAGNEHPQHPQHPQGRGSADIAGQEYGQSRDDDACAACRGEGDGCGWCGGTGRLEAGQ